MVYSDHYSLGKLCVAWGEAAYRLGQYCESELLYLRALDHIERHPFDEDGEAEEALCHLAALYFEQKSYKKMRKLYLQAVQIYAKELEVGHENVSKTIKHLNNVCQTLEDASLKGRQIRAKRVVRH